MILFTSDLLFGSKILGAARHAGLRGQGVRSRAALDRHAPEATHLFLDLEADLGAGESPEAILDAALGHPNLRVFAFAGHLETGRLRAAHARLAMDGRGHEVHSRGSLHAKLPTILPPARPAAVTPPSPGRPDGVR